jgi:hypothetical protein
VSRPPIYLQRITRVPSWRFALRNLCGRILRRVRGIERPPVTQPLTEDQWRALESRCGLLTGSLAAALICIALLMLYRGATC